MNWLILTGVLFVGYVAIGGWIWGRIGKTNHPFGR